MATDAFFTTGLVLFEVPTGVVADLRGRRLAHLLGTLTLALSTLLNLLLWRISALCVRKPRCSPRFLA